MGQDELAKILGFKDGDFIARVEKGEHSIPVSKAKKICLILSIDYDSYKSAFLGDFKDILSAQFGPKSDKDH